MNYHINKNKTFKKSILIFFSLKFKLVTKTYLFCFNLLVIFFFFTQFNALIQSLVSLIMYNKNYKNLILIIFVMRRIKQDLT